LGEILFGGFAKPLHPLDLILWYALAVQVAEAEIILSPGVILLGGFAIPLHRLYLILRHAFALVVAVTEFHLRLCVACFCLPLHFLDRFLISLGLLRGQLNDSDTRRQQKREYQPTRFHIGKPIGSNPQSRCGFMILFSLMALLRAASDRE